jgi:hypothetical protein
MVIGHLWALCALCADCSWRKICAQWISRCRHRPLNIRWAWLFRNAGHRHRIELDRHFSCGGTAVGCGVQCWVRSDAGCGPMLGWGAAVGCGAWLWVSLFVTGTSQLRYGICVKVEKYGAQ